MQLSTVVAARLQGIACALAELADAHMEPDLAEMVLHNMGLTVADLKDAGADHHDLARPKDRKQVLMVMVG